MKTVLQSILDATTDPRVRSSMATGAGLEGGTLGTGPFPVGDHGHSFGPYQINHSNGMHANISPADSNDPEKATRYMLGEYEGAVARVPSSLWASNPEAASERAAFLAERPAQDYVTARAPGVVDTAYSNAADGIRTGHASSGSSSGGNVGSDLLHGLSTAGGYVADLTNPLSLANDGLGLFGSSVGGLVSGAASDAASSAFQAVLPGLFGGFGKLLIMGAAITVGGGLVVAGLYKSVSQTAPVQAATGAVKQAGTTAATAAIL